MITLESLEIENFRGIRRLTVDFNRANHAVYGPNGTGKSGIVDAIEFGLTGNLTRLTGRGTGGITVRKHGPHVDYRNSPDKATVSLSAYSPELNKVFRITRTVGNPSNPDISPSEPDVISLARDLALHPEIALSRREILKYVIAEDGSRSKEVQALLRLEQLELTRASLQRILNDAKKRHEAGDSEVNRANATLLAILKIPQLTRQGVVDAVNERRKVLGLQALSELTKDSNLREGVATATQSRTAAQSVKKATALADISKLESDAAAKEPLAVSQSRQKVIDRLSRLLAEPMLLKNLRRRNFLSAGLELIDGNECPLCETQWEIDELKALIKKRIEAAKEAEELRAGLELDGTEFRRAIDIRVSLINSVKLCAERLGRHADAEQLSQWVAALELLKKSIVSGKDIPATLDKLANEWGGPSELAQKAVDEVRKVVATLPDESAEDQAKEFLIICQERLEGVRSAQRNRELWKVRRDVAEVAVREFETASKTALNALYDDVEAEFSRFYSLIHSDDEKRFLGELTPSLGKLSFNVDFYGKGKYPPGAYHSEGHQDSMGLCLYLALMKKTFGTGFRVAVLDDVLMSVDQGHRGEVCKLLKSEFPDTQFIVTTHDRVWLNHMLSEQLVVRKGTTEFRRWTVEDGPFGWTPTDVWEDIADSTKNNDIPRAAHTLRFYLERVTGDIAQRLRGQVEYRSNQSYDPAELLNSSTARLGDLLRKSIASAHSWNDEALHSEMTGLEKEFKERKAAKEVVSWMLNPSVHYNEWNNLSPNEFNSLVEACKQLMASFTCAKCSGLLYVEPKRGGSAETLACDCRAIKLTQRPRN